MEMIDAGKCVRFAQERSQVSSAELSRLTKTSPQQVLRWRKHKNMKLHTMQLICYCLETSIVDFLALPLGDR
jgi:DNA-binding Xre family transcriptional regulator